MTVGKLIELLSTVPQDYEVLVDDGIRYRELKAEVNKAYWDPEEREAYGENWSHQEACMREDQWEEFQEDAQRCQILYLD